MTIEDEPAVALTSTTYILAYKIEFQIERSPYLADFTETSSQTVTENPSPQPAEVSHKQSLKPHRKQPAIVCHPAKATVEFGDGLACQYEVVAV
jgi:hypothetical protein